MSIYLSNSISPEGLEFADALMLLFVKDFEIIYGMRFCSITVHSLLQLGICIRKFGPLWGYSCFAFESMYHYIRKMVHGTNYILPQLQYSHFVVKQIRTLFKDLVGDDTKKFIRDLGLNLDSGYHQIQPRPKSSISLRVLATTWLLLKRLLF
jgi:hypothetical protein